MIKLRELKESDSKRIAELINNKNIWDQLRDAVPYPYYEIDAEKFVNLAAADSQQIHYGIEFDSILVGVVGLIMQSDIYRLSAELGFWLGEAYWGNGIMPQAIKKIVEIGFTEYNILRIYSTVKEHNKQSQKALEKAGFSLEAVLKKAIIKNDVIQDEYRYFVINENFKN